MPISRTVLVVSPTKSVARATVTAATRNGYNVVVVQSFAEAKRQLANSPQLLVTELKLGEYNGLHLAVWASGSDIPAVVIAEEAFEQEIEALGAVWVSPDAVAGMDLQMTMVRLLQGEGAVDTARPWESGSESTAENLPSWDLPSSPTLH